MYNAAMARPKKPPGEAATERIDLRLTPAERETYERAAKRADKTLSAWIKERLNKAAKGQSQRD